MSFDALERVWTDSTARGSGLIVLLCIASHQGRSGDSWPSIGRLAERSRLSERQVSRLISELERTGELAIIHGRGRHVSNRYAVLSGLNEEERAEARERLQLSYKKEDVAMSGFIPKKEDVAMSGFIPKKEDVAMSGFQNHGDKNRTNGDKKQDISDKTPGVKHDIAVSYESLIFKSSNNDKEGMRLIWSAIVDQIRADQNRGKALADNWLKDCELKGLRGDILIVETRSSYATKYLEDHARQKINTFLPGMFNRPAARVQFVTGGLEV